MLEDFSGWNVCNNQSCSIIYPNIHEPMHYAAIESNMRISKRLKVKAWFLLNCDQNFKIPLLTGEQLFKY